MMKLIELVKGLETSDETLQVIKDFCQKVGKETVVCLKDTQGFITTRLISIFGVEAFRILEEGIATREDVDKACKLAFNHPMGPFELHDFTGLDTSLHVSEAMEKAFGERFRTSPTHRNLVKAGYLGRKVGKGCILIPQENE